MEKVRLSRERFSAVLMYGLSVWWERLVGRVSWQNGWHDAADADKSCDKSCDRSSDGCDDSCNDSRDGKCDKIWRELLDDLPGGIFYVGSGESLPAPFTPAEEAAIMCRLAAGDVSVRSELIEHNLRLVVYIARKFESSGIGIEDLSSIGTIGLIKAVNTFDPNKNIKLATYASRCIENEILMTLRRTSRQKSEVSFDEPLNVDWDGNELLLSDVLGTDGDIIYRELEEEVDRKLLRVAITRLSAREKMIMEMRFGLCGHKVRTQKEVAEVLGISQSYISRLEKRIFARLKKEILRME